MPAASSDDNPEALDLPRSKRGFWGCVIRIGIVGLLFLGIALFFVWGYYHSLASREDIQKVGEMPERSLVFDRSGVELGRMHGVNRNTVDISSVSVKFIDALLAREDARFYDHGGVDWRGVARAGVRNISDGNFTQGASTLTMQLARVSYGYGEKTIHRKVLEAFLAQRIEENYTKDEILTLYMNRIYFGTGLYGVERASQAYFGKAALDLNLGEAAMLAGIIRAPNRFSPFRNYDDAVLQRNDVLDRMLTLGYATEAEVLAARQTTIAVQPQSVAQVQQTSYALDAIRRDLDVILNQTELEDGGLLIYTSLDAGMQVAAETSLETRLREVEALPDFLHPARGVTSDYLQGAIVALDNSDGGILALVGGRSFEESQFNRALQSERQVGSTFKPFVYTAAWEKGLLPGTWVDDGPIGAEEFPWWPGNWAPNNSDGSFLGYQPAESGLIRSRNTMTIRVGERATFRRVSELASYFGFELPEDPSQQLFIGNLGIDLKALASAYSAFPNDGYRYRPWIIQLVQDRRGNVIFQNTQLGYQVMPKESAWLTTRTMEKVFQPGGTAASARSTQGFSAPAAGKTGTTDDYRDAWFAGFTDRVTCGVWVGFDQPKRIMDRGYGSRLALPIWVDVLQSAEENGFAGSPFATSVPLTGVELCRLSGQIANRGCRRNGTTYTDMIPSGLVPIHECTEHRQILPIPLPQPSEDGDGIFRGLRGIFGND